MVDWLNLIITVAVVLVPAAVAWGKTQADVSWLRRELSKHAQSMDARLERLDSRIDRVMDARGR